jgi:DNA polymerase I-like protein with 3'-5' exonuclease and polymerase domains
MEAAGIRVDVERLRKIATNAQAAAAKASTDLRDALGNPGLNPASPAQLLAALRSKGITLDSTAEETLKAADDGRIIPLILAHREASKRAQQAETLIEHVKTESATTNL